MQIVRTFGRDLIRPMHRALLEAASPPAPIDPPAPPVTLNISEGLVTWLNVGEGNLEFSITDPDRGWVDHPVSTSSADADAGVALNTAQLAAGPLILDQPIIAGDGSPDVGETIAIIPPLWANDAANGAVSISYTGVAGVVDATDPDQPTYVAQAGDVGSLAITAVVTDTAGSRVVTSNALPLTAPNVYALYGSSAGAFTDYPGINAVSSELTVAMLLQKDVAGAFGVLWGNAACTAFVSGGSLTIIVRDDTAAEISRTQYAGVDIAAVNHIVFHYDTTLPGSTKAALYVDGVIEPPSTTPTAPSAGSGNLGWNGTIWTVGANTPTNTRNPVNLAAFSQVVVSTATIPVASLYNGGVVADLSAIDGQAAIVIDGTRLSAADMNGTTNNNLGTSGNGTPGGTYADAGSDIGV